MNHAFRLRENKANSNPIQTQSPSAIRDTQYEIRDTNPIKLEANLSLRERRSLRVSFSESSNRGPISKAKKCPSPDISPFFCNFCALFNHFSLFFTLLFKRFRMFSNVFDRFSLAYFTQTLQPNLPATVFLTFFQPICVSDINFSPQ